MVHHALGNAEADEELAELIRIGSTDFAYQAALRAERCFAPLHGDPRWNSLLARMGLHEN